MLKSTKLFSNNKSGVKGVYFSASENRWIAFITINKKTIKRRFLKKEDAIKYRKNLEYKYFKPVIDKYNQ